MSTAEALQFNIHAHSQDLPLGASAGVSFFEFYLIMQMQVHSVPPVNPYVLAAYNSLSENQAVRRQLGCDIDAGK